MLEPLVWETLTHKLSVICCHSQWLRRRDDVDACVTLSRCRPTNVENIFWQLTAPRGRYRIYVVNYNGAAAGPFRIQVAGVGLAPQEFMGTLGAAAGTRSTDFFIDR